MREVGSEVKIATHGEEELDGPTIDLYMGKHPRIYERAGLSGLMGVGRSERKVPHIGVKV